MKVTVIALACIALAPLAFAQETSSNTVSGPTKKVTDQMSSHTGIGTVDGFTPGNSISVVSSALTHPVKYRLGKSVRYENQSGSTIPEGLIRPGARVSLEFGDDKKVDRVIVVDTTGER